MERIEKVKLRWTMSLEEEDMVRGREKAHSIAAAKTETPPGRSCARSGRGSIGSRD